MIVFISPSNRQTHTKYLNEYFLIRKKYFCDYFGWVVANENGHEKDELDDEYNITILYIDPIRDIVVGGVRLVPTTGKTLIHNVWSDMLPEPDDFISPNIWEATRFCVDDEDAEGRNSKLVNRISLALMLAILDFSALNGITSIISVCEQKIVKMINVFSSGLEIISEKTDENGCEIACTLWSTDEQIRQSINWARPFIGGTEPIKHER